MTTDSHTLAYYMRTGMSDDKLKAIGFITLLWNRIEWDLQELVWTIARWNPEVGSLVTADLGNIGRVQLARNLMNAHQLHERLLTEIDVVLDIFDANRTARNALVHGLPVYDDDRKLSGRLASFDAKKGVGTLQVKHTNVSGEYLTHMRNDMVFCQEALADAVRKLQNLRRFEADAKIAEQYTLVQFVFEYRAPPIDIHELQKCLGSIRSRIPKRVSPQTQSPS